MDNTLDPLRKQQLEALQQAENSDDDFLQEAAEGWQAAGMDKMDAILNRIDQRIDERTGAQSAIKESPVVPIGRPSRAGWWIGLAASVMLAVLAIFFFSKEDKALTSDELFAMYYQPLQAPEPVFRGENNSSTPQKVQQASDLYGNGQYDQAIAYYQELLKEYPLHPKYTLFLGLSYMQQEKYNEAIALFNTHVPSGTTYDEDIQWYLSLAHLKQGNLNTARTMLEKFRDSEGSYYKTNAGQIIAQMPVR